MVKQNGDEIMGKEVKRLKRDGSNLKDFPQLHPKEPTRMEIEIMKMIEEYIGLQQKLPRKKTV